MQKPNAFSSAELAKVNVEILRQHGQTFLRCLICGTVWTPPTKGRQLQPNYWQCPNHPHPDAPTRKEVAYHEAGHAVMAHLLGIPIVEASIEVSSGTLGHVSYTVPFENLPPSQQVMITLAGPIAEDMITKIPRFVTFEDILKHSESDWRGVVVTLNRYKEQVNLSEHYKVAKYMLKKYRQNLKQLANALLDQQLIQGNDVVTAMGM